MSKNRDKIISCILIGCLFIFYHLLFEYRREHKDVEINKLLTTVYANPNINFDFHFDSNFDYYTEDQIVELIDRYKSLSMVNFDVVGIINFPSGLMNRTIVQGRDNVEYLDKDWTTGTYLEYGSVFVDANDTLDSGCLRIYGNTNSASLGKLMALVDEEVLDKNRVFSFILENEIRYYEIVDIEETSEDYNDYSLVFEIDDEIVINCKEIGRDLV